MGDDEKLWKPQRSDGTRQLDSEVWTIRLHWGPHDDGRVYWVDWAVWPAGLDAPLDVAPDVHGFLKWDGCFQWWVNAPGHADSEGELVSWFGAILEARRAAAAVMGENYDG